MILPSVASCDSARTRPPFLASSRPPKNLRNEPWFLYYVKQINSIRKSSIFDPFQFSRGDPFGPIFLEWNPPFGCFAFSEDICWFYRICGCSASTLPHILKFFQIPMRDVSHIRRTYVDIYRICAWPVSHLPHKIQLSQHPVRDVTHSRRTYIDFYRICGCSVSILPCVIHFLPFRIALYM